MKTRILSIFLGILVVGFLVYFPTTPHEKIHVTMESSRGRASSNFKNDKNDHPRVSKKSRPSEISNTGPRGELRRLNYSANEYERLVNLASDMGDFSGLEEYFNHVGEKERYEVLIAAIGIFSPMGPTHDVKKKLGLLNKLNQPSSVLASLHEKIIEVEARERYDEMKQEGFLASLSDGDFAVACRSITKCRVAEGFKMVGDGKSESAKRHAAGEVARTAIASGLMEASVEIGKLEPGIVRDEAVVELVKWLRRTGSPGEALAWAETVKDDVSRAKIPR
jgi:hypothetical protein